MQKIQDYITGHEHLVYIANGLDEIKSPVAKKIAKLMRGQSESEVFGVLPEKIEIAMDEILLKKGKVKITSKKTIRYTKKYLLHTDNSGHFDGLGHGKNGHSDLHPLTIQEISKLPTMLKTAKKTDVYYDGEIRGRQRFTVLKNLNNTTILEIVEITSNGKFIDIITAYRIGKRIAKQIRKNSH